MRNMLARAAWVAILVPAVVLAGCGKDTGSSQGGRIQVVAAESFWGSIVSQLTNAGLIDEYHVAVHPVVLGGGRRLFAEPKERINLRLIDSRTVDGQVVVKQYRPS